MLKKLLKYELRATGRLYLPLFTAILVFSVLGRFTIGAGVWKVTTTSHSFSINPAGESLVSKIVGFAAGVILILYILAILGALVVHFIITLQRFWKNLMGDEGYLMFTLPVSVDHLLWSKALVALLWSVATFVVVGLSVLLLAYQPGMLGDAIAFLRQEIGVGSYELMTVEMILSTIFSRTFWVGALVSIPISGLGGTFLLYAAMSIGHTVRNHKVLASVGGYMAISVVASIASSALTGAFLVVQNRQMVEMENMSIYNQEEMLRLMEFLGGYLNTTMILGVVISVLMAAGAYLIARYLMTSQLNLE